jgi:hypothetical protein
MLKNITLSADENLIKKAREKAHQESTTLNASFRQWLSQFANSSTTAEDYDQLTQSLKYVRTDRKYTRSDMNER